MIDSMRLIYGERVVDDIGREIQINYWVDRLDEISRRVERISQENVRLIDQARGGASKPGVYTSMLLEIEANNRKIKQYDREYRRIVARIHAARGKL